MVEFRMDSKLNVYIDKINKTILPKVKTAPSKNDCESPKYKIAGLFDITFKLADMEVDNFDAPDSR